MWGKVRRNVGEVWESVWGECGKVCWGVGEVRREVWGMWRKVRGDGGEEVWGRCGRAYGVSVEGVEKCVGEVREKYGVYGGR